MIVVEGCDGVGKTTLVKHLSEKFGLQIGKRGVADRDKLYEVTRSDTYNALAAAINGPAQVWDRLFISEFIYADIVSRPCEFSDYEREFVVDVMNALKCPVILCSCPWTTALGNVVKAKQMSGVLENYKLIYDRYAMGAFPSPANVMWYDYTDSHEGWATLEDVEEEVDGYLANRHLREATWVPQLH